MWIFSWHSCQWLKMLAHWQPETDVHGKGTNWDGNVREVDRIITKPFGMFDRVLTWQPWWRFKWKLIKPISRFPSLSWLGNGKLQQMKHYELHTSNKNGIYQALRWRHDTKTRSALLALCEGNHFPHKGQVTGNFSDSLPSKLLNKQCSCQWFW